MWLMIELQIEKLILAHKHRKAGEKEIVQELSKALASHTVNPGLVQSTLDSSTSTHED